MRLDLSFVFQVALVRDDHNWEIVLIFHLEQSDLVGRATRGEQSQSVGTKMSSLGESADETWKPPRKNSSRLSSTPRENLRLTNI